MCVQIFCMVNIDVPAGGTLILAAQQMSTGFGTNTYFSRYDFTLHHNQLWLDMT